MTFIERDCIVEYEGKRFESRGAYVSDQHIVAYPGPDGRLNDWHGLELGTWRATSSWPVNSHYGHRMYQIEATVNGVTYTGRGFGQGMIYRGRRKANR